MTKPGRVVAVLLIAFLTALLWAPVAAAHGAPAARSFDTRVLQDWTGPAAGTDAGEHVGEYNGMHTGAPFGPAHDILAVDVREAYDAAGEPCLRIRFVFQGGDPIEGGELNDTVNFTLGGNAFGFFLATLDNEAWTTDFPSLEGPFPVGDGFPLALDGIVPYSALGAQPGDILGNVTVAASYHDASMNGMRMVGDEAPGGFYYSHFAVPAPNDDSIQVDYPLQGPADLLLLAAGAAPDPMKRGENATLELTVATPLNDTEQRVTFTVQAPAGFEAAVETPLLVLGPDAPEAPVRITLRALGNATAGNVTVVAASDLGFRAAAVFTVDLVKAPDPVVIVPVTETPAPEALPTESVEDADHAHADDAHQDSPALPAVLLLAALALAAAWTRRR